MNSLQSFNSVANDSWENNPLAPFSKGESMIRQQYPELDISPEDFADAWNEMPECREAAEARLSETRSNGFDLTFTAGVVTVLLGVVGSASYELDIIGNK